MYLKALEIQGFKSFPDKTVLTFGEPVTGIVGPNGSGKSNISDAIRWVMGEQSTKALRGGKMEDVIFGGTAKRKQLGYAEVSLILDNEDHRFPMEESEVMITRRYYRSGDSEYYINRHSCRLKDINELLMDTGLGREGYSIIGQGKIDEILSTKGSERRSVFEEAAGISRFRHRKEEAEHRLEKTADNLLRVGDKISELELQLEPLRGQAEKAKEFLAYRDELKGLEISLWLENLDELRTNHRKLATDYEAATAQRDGIKTEQETLYARAEALAQQMRDCDVETEQLRTRQSALEGESNERESSIAVLKSQVQRNPESADRLQRELDQQEGRADSIAAQIAQRQERLREIAAQRQTLEDTLAGHRLEEAENRRQAGTLAEELEALRSSERIQNASLADAKELLSALAASGQEMIDRDTSLRASIQENQEKLTQTEAEARAKQKELNDTKDQRDSLENVIAGHQMKASSRNQKLEEAQGKVNQLTLDSNNLSGRIHMLTEMEKLYEGYSKAVKAVMQAAERKQLRGIHGPVASLIKVPEQYTVAIETALGAAQQNLVVDREEDGKAAINYLKRRDAGRATFLPLSAVRANYLKERNVEQCRGFVGVASALVTCEQKYADVVGNLLGRVVITEDMDAAIAMARQFGHRFRIVTLDGQVLNPGGSMTGGSTSRSAGILSRASELERLEKQSAQLKEDMDEARRALADAKREAERAAYEMEVAQNQKRVLDDTVLRLDGEYGQYRILLGVLRDSRDNWQDELESLRQRAKKLEEDTEEARQRIETLEDSAAALRTEAEGKAAGQDVFRKQAEAIAAAIAEVHVAQASLDAEQSATLTALDELKAMERDITGDRENRRRQIEEYGQRNEELTDRIRALEEALQTLRTSREALTNSLQKLSARRLELEAQRTQADRDARDKNEALLNMERECSALERKKAAAAMEESQLLSKLWDSYELTYDSAQPQRQELESVAKAGRRIAELKRGISALGNVNVGAIEEFRRISERYDYLTAQRDDVEKAKAELEEIIDGITEEMKKIFAEQFDLIADAFSATFQELFGGGKAALELEDPEDILNCNIEIKVQPPGKALKVLSLLSGGEKAFVAIALYFAFLKVRPTPFVVMDEIEAALDDPNVTRFAHYVRSMSDKTQFIIITHRRGTMEEADVLYGVTMQERGISRVLTVNLNEVAEELNIQ